LENGNSTGNRESETLRHSASSLLINENERRFQPGSELDRAPLGFAATSLILAPVVAVVGRSRLPDLSESE
jgi:hypothetical protein